MTIPTSMSNSSHRGVSLFSFGGASLQPFGKEIAKLVNVDFVVGKMQVVFVLPHDRTGQDGDVEADLAQEPSQGRQALGMSVVEDAKPGPRSIEKAQEHRR